MPELQILHPDGVLSFYSIGPEQEYDRWAIRPEGIIIYKTGALFPRDRVHILPGSIRSINVVFQR